MKHTKLFTAGLVLALCTVGALPVYAQDAGSQPSGGTTGSTDVSVKVSVDLRDAPVRDALEQLFRNAKVDFIIAPDVRGMVTMNLTDLPLDQVLKIICRSNTMPLTFSKEGKRYEIKVRKTNVEPRGVTEIRVPEAPDTTSAQFDVVQLRYLDPRQLQGLMNIIMLPSAADVRSGNQGNRNGQNSQNGSGNAPGGNQGGNPGGNRGGNNGFSGFGFPSGNGGNGLILGSGPRR
jgi:type II secretory pathway component GspD/PulD (secretin)